MLGLRIPSTRTARESRENLFYNALDAMTPPARGDENGIFKCSCSTCIIAKRIEHITFGMNQGQHSSVL